MTAGNACPINDGAALVLIMSRDKCEQLNLTPILRFVDSQAAGVDPVIRGSDRFRRSGNCYAARV